MRRPFLYLILVAVLVWWVNTMQPSKSAILDNPEILAPEAPFSLQHEMPLSPSTLKATP